MSDSVTTEFGIHQHNAEMVFAFVANTASSFGLGKVAIVTNPTVTEGSAWTATLCTTGSSPLSEPPWGGTRFFPLCTAKESRWSLRGEVMQDTLL